MIATIDRKKTGSPRCIPSPGSWREDATTCSWQ